MERKLYNLRMNGVFKFTEHFTIMNYYHYNYSFFYQ